jgi:hypothetical protein
MSHDAKHEGSELYVVCTHLLESRDPKMIGAWDDIGMDLICSMKFPLEHKDEELKVCCARCLTEMGLLPVPAFDWLQ